MKNYLCKTARSASGIECSQIGHVRS